MPTDASGPGCSLSGEGSNWGALQKARHLYSDPIERSSQPCGCSILPEQSLGMGQEDLAKNFKPPHVRACERAGMV